MTIQTEYGILKKQGTWVNCLCGKKILKVQPDTEAKNLPVHCRHCKRDMVVTIQK